MVFLVSYKVVEEYYSRRKVELCSGQVGRVFPLEYSVKTYVIHLLKTYITILCDWLIL